MIKRDPEHNEGHIGLADILSETGQIDKAKAVATEVLRINPKFSVSKYISSIAYRDQAETLKMAEGLKKVGLPN